MGIGIFPNDDEAILKSCQKTGNEFIQRLRSSEYFYNNENSNNTAPKSFVQNKSNFISPKGRAIYLEQFFGTIQ